MERFVTEFRPRFSISSRPLTSTFPCVRKTQVPVQVHLTFVDSLEGYVALVVSLIERSSNISGDFCNLLSGSVW